MADELTKKVMQVHDIMVDWHGKHGLKLEKMQNQLDEIDLRHRSNLGAGPACKSLKSTLEENDSVARLLKDGKGRAIFTVSGDQVTGLMQQKSLISGASGFGLAAGGVMPIERSPSIVQEARRRLRLRDILPSRPTESPLIYDVKVSSPLAIASPQVEGNTKAENTLQFNTAGTPVQTIATFLKASRQILDDFTELEGFLRASLPYYVNKAVDLQLLSGSGTGQDLNGLITQATGFNVGLLSPAAGYTRIDVIGAAAEQVDLIDEVPATFVVLNPRDWWNLRRTKDGFGKYILGDPQSQGDPTIWDLTPVPTTAMPSGAFLVGNGDPAAVEIRDRMETVVDISTEDVDNFQKNMVTIRAECRLALLVHRPQSFIYGTFTTSPAGF